MLFSIHGGGFTGGDGGPTSGQDTGNFASREDIVGVEINYRLSTLGFLAIPGTDIKGNFGIGDQITALEWVKKNIAQFGGDPNRVTIVSLDTIPVLAYHPGVDKCSSSCSKANVIYRSAVAPVQDLFVLFSALPESSAKT